MDIDQVAKLERELNEKIKFPNTWDIGRVQRFVAKLVLNNYLDFQELKERLEQGETAAPIQIEGPSLTEIELPEDIQLSQTKSEDEPEKPDGYQKPNKNDYLGEDGKIKMGEYLAACRKAKAEATNAE